MPDAQAACPLSPALVSLLQSCLDARSTHDKKLAERLCLSPETIHTEFKLIARCLNTHDRFEAVLLAWEKGWIHFAPPPRRLKRKLQIYEKLTRKITPNRGIASRPPA